MRELRDLQGADLGKGDYDNRTPLHVAVVNSQLQMIKFLVEECKVEVNPVDRWGSTPLCDAINKPAVKDYLVSKGARLGKLMPYHSIAGDDS